jgi:hypothetical protein
MVRRQKGVDFSRVLSPEDLDYVHRQIDAQSWYPMETFERLGLAILDHVSGATLDAVRLWGRFSVNQFHGPQSNLIAEREPVESLMRLKVMRSTLFDFPAFDIPMLAPGHAYVVMTYHMSPRAEEAACYQTMGFCEGVLALAGAENVRADSRERGWELDPRTLLELEWD